MGKKLKQTGKKQKDNETKVTDNVSEVAAPAATAVEAVVESLVEETKNMNVNSTEQEVKENLHIDTSKPEVVNKDVALVKEHPDNEVTYSEAHGDGGAETKQEIQAKGLESGDVEAFNVSELEIDSELKSCDKPVNVRKFYARELLIQLLSKVPTWRPVLPDMDIVLKNPNKLQFVPLKITRNVPLSNNFASSKISDKDITLHRSTHAWKPINKDGSETESVILAMRSLLNKLTSENFDKITSAFKDLQLDSAEKLKGCIKLLFEKAVMEPGFSSIYARMAYSLSGISIIDGSNEKPLTFRFVLLNECQAEFEKDRKDETIFSELAEKINAAKTNEEKKQFTEERELAIYMAKKRSLGNVRFIGELFKLNMLSEGIMIHCLSKLLSKRDDVENLECLCQLLTTIGLQLDLKSKPKVDALMGELDKFVMDKATSSRIRFMIMNVVDLRKSGWVSKSSNQNNQRVKQCNDAGSVNKLYATSKAVAESSKILSNPDTNKSDGFLEVKRAKKVKPEKKTGEKVNSKNKFHLLMDLCSEDVEETPTKFIKKISSKNSEPVDIKFLNPTIPKIPPSNPSAGLNQERYVIKREDMELKVKARVEEYLSLKDLNEAMDLVRELKTDVCETNATRFFFISLCQSIEKNSAVRNYVGILHKHIIDNSIASVESYAKALIKFALFANDLEIDIPHVWSNVAEYIVPVVLESFLLKIDVFAQDLTHVDPEIDGELSEEEDDCTAKLLAAVLNGISASKGEAQAKKLWTDSDLKWKTFLKHNQLVTLLRRLSFIVSKMSPDINLSFTDDNDSGLKSTKVKKSNPKKSAIEKMAKKRMGGKGRGVVFVKHIPYGFFEKEMDKYFGQFGGVTKVRLSRSKRTGQSKGYGYIEFAHEDTAKAAADAMKDYLMFRKRLTCKFVPKSELHPNTFKGWQRPFSMPKASKIDIKRQNKPHKSERAKNLAEKKLKSKNKKRMDKITKLGVSYELPA